MPSPEIDFSSKEEQLQYAVKTLVEAGFTPEQVDKIRTKVGLGPGKIPYTQEITGQRRFMVQELLAARMSNRQIAEALQLSKETVSSDRIHNRKIWSNEILKSQDSWRARLVQEQHELKELALQGYEQSKKKRMVTTKEDSGETIIKVEESAGESSFLTVARSCLEQQARLIGLFDIKPQIEDNKSGYKGFLDTLSREVKKIQAAEKNADDRSGAIETNAEFDDDGAPTGHSRPLLSAEDNEPSAP